VDGRVRRALAAVALTAIAACADPAGTAGTATLALAPTFAAGTRLDALNLVIDNVRVTVLRPAAETVLADQTAPFNVESQEVLLAVLVPLQQPSETLFVGVELRAGTQVLFSGGQTMAVTSGVVAGAPVPVQVGYVGPGANVASLIILPRDTTVSTSDSLQFTVTAIDAAQAPVPDFYAGWSTSDTLLARVDATGLLIAPPVAPVRAGVRVRAITPTGVGDSVLVTFQGPAPALIGGVVTNALTSALLPGATVTIKTGGNAALADPPLQTVTTDAAGAYLITGLVPGSYTLFVQAVGFITARIPGITLASGEQRTLDVALSLGAAPAP
jgi:hypothetical protein